jgi:putative NADH-flavin reductase
MKLLLLGATGGTGLQVIQQALARRHQVTAFVRNPAALSPMAGAIEVVSGDLMAPSQLARVLLGQDAVICTFTPTAGTRQSWAQFASALTQAMTGAHVRRLIVTSVGFLFRRSLFPPAFLIGSLFFRDIVSGAAAMERVIVRSALDWALVRPPRLTDGPRAPRYRVSYGSLPWWGLTLSRSDLAEYLLAAAGDAATIHQTVGIAR